MFDNVETVAADVRVREALGLSIPTFKRGRWIGLRYEAQPDGSRLLVGVCHAHNTPCGCRGHTLALRNLTDATACCLGCGLVVTLSVGAQGAKMGRAVLGDDGQVMGSMCRACHSRARRANRRTG